METYFAPPGRSDACDINREIEIVNRSSVVDTLLHSVSGLLAIINENRQVIAVNDAFLNELGISDPRKTLGLRPGEALQCVHAHDEPDGCGTTKFCSTCGAAIAIVSSLGFDKTAERVCALTAVRDGKEVDTCLLVRSHPVKIDADRFLLLFLQDISAQWQRSALEKIFFHDVNNILTGLMTSSSMLSDKNLDARLVLSINQAVSRLAQEISIQRCLHKSDHSAYVPMLETTTVNQILRELQDLFMIDLVAKKKRSRLSMSDPDVAVETDVALSLRVLGNMVTNALEATGENDEIRVWAEREGRSTSFCVWNRQPIDKTVALRIFQRNYSTKKGDGRGLGTYSMKLLGEQYLGGKVSFSTSEQDGTVFRFTLPN